MDSVGPARDDHVRRRTEPPPAVDFTTACNRAASISITLREIARELGVPARTLRRSRLPPASRDHRPPPEGWERAIAMLARYRASELIALAQELEGRGSGEGFWHG